MKEKQKPKARKRKVVTLFPCLPVCFLAAVVAVAADCIIMFGVGVERVHLVWFHLSAVLSDREMISSKHDDGDDDDDAHTRKAPNRSVHLAGENEKCSPSGRL